MVLRSEDVNVLPKSYSQPKMKLKNCSIERTKYKCIIRALKKCTLMSYFGCPQRLGNRLFSPLLLFSSFNYSFPISWFYIRQRLFGVFSVLFCCSSTHSTTATSWSWKGLSSRGGQQNGMTSWLSWRLSLCFLVSLVLKLWGTKFSLSFTFISSRKFECFWNHALHECIG